MARGLCVEPTMPGDDRRVTGRAAENNARGSAHWLEAKRVGHYPTNAALHFHHFADFLESLASDNEGKA
jgi:hypothetical protein